MGNSRCTGRVAGALAVICFSLGCGKPAAVAPSIDRNGPVEVVLPERGAYTGAFIDFGEAEDEVALETIEGFEQMVGKHQAIIASSSYWGEQNFPNANLQMIWRHGSLPLVFWSPWDRPYEQKKGPDRFSLNAILAGTWNRYIDDWADAARGFGHPLIVSFGDEMNGDWFPWSGIYYGGNKKIPGPVKRWEGPELFKRAFRYVVERVRARGAHNIQWMFQTNNYSSPVDVWNSAAAYYPGSAYVDWLGLSVYGQQFSEEPWVDFPPLIEWPYEEMARVDRTKPIMIAEWGVGEFPNSGDKAEWIRDAFALMERKLPRMKAAVYWHERWQNEDQTYSNLHLNSSPEALAAYRKGVADPFWHGDLALRSAPAAQKKIPAR
ncbi:MAG TPA: glycosyl hydrolase [Chthoniobacterales bacterium]